MDNGDPTTKDATHLRRTGDCVGVTVHFALGMMIKWKDDFLNSKANRQQSIHYISGNLDRTGCILDHHANDDADVLIFHTAVASSRYKSCLLIRDDADVLVLLLHHAKMDAHRVFLKSEPKQSP